jgi:hypothetical protein
MIHRSARPGFLLALALLIAGCAPAAQIVVLAPTETPAGAVVPTRAPTETSLPTFTPVPPTQTVSAPATDEPTSTSTLPPTPTATATLTPTTAPSDTPVPSPTSTPTNTPPPTSTLRPPTDTPAPAATATHTPRPMLPSPTAAAQNLGPVVYGQTTALSETLTVGSTVSGVIDSATPWLIYPLDTPPDEALNFRLDASAGALQPVLHIVDATGKQIARSPAVDSSGYLALRGFEPQAVGSYYLVVTRNGAADGALLDASSGPFELSVTAGSAAAQAGIFSQPIAYGQRAQTTIDDDQPMQVFTFDGSAGDVITIQTVGIHEGLDTWLELTDSLGNVIARNDDDPLLSTLDSAIYDFRLPATQPYAIVVSRYSGSEGSGEFQIKFTRTSQTADDVRLALFNHANSVTLLDNQTPITDFRAGDQLTADNQDVRAQTLLTFHLPALPAGVTAAEATLQLNACTEVGEGFNGLGALRIYADPYGDLAGRRDFTRPTAGARLIAELDTCGPVDVTETVADAYAAGQSTVQFRLAFNAAITNQQIDEVRFQPALVIWPAE